MGLFPRNSSKGPSKESSSHSRSPQKRRRDNTASEPPKSKKAKQDEGESKTAPLKSKALVDGTSVVGVVCSVFKDRLQVDLPMGQRGVVNSADACESGDVDLRTVYKVGQVVVAIVTSCPSNTKGGKKSRDDRFGLSLKCELFRQRFTWKLPPAKNQLLVAYITSIEEHGATASLGANSELRIFIKTDIGLLDLTVGQIVYLTVEAVKKEAKLIVCKFGRESRPRFLAYNSDCDVTSLTAGQLVEMKITTCISGSETAAKKTATSKLFPCQVDGLDVSFCRTMSGYVPRSHLHHPLVKIEDVVSPLEAAYPFKKGLTQSNKRAATWPRQSPRFGRDDIVLARILSVTHDQEQGPQVCLSLLPHIVHFHLPDKFVSTFDGVSVGSLIEDARVVFANKETGVKLIAGPVTETETPTDGVFSEWQLDLDQSLLLCSPKKFVADETPEFAISNLNVGEKRKCRVLNRNFCDGTFLVGLGDKSISAEIFCANNLSVGQIVKSVELHKRLDWGFYVKLSEHLQAKLMKEQVSDVVIDKIPEKYKEGSTVKLRVLRIDPRTNTVQMTAKKSFVSMSDEALGKQLEPQSKIKLNDCCEVYVDKFTDRSILLRGFADFSGLLPFEDIATTLYSDSTSPVSSSTHQRIISSKKFKVGATLRVRVHKLRRTTDSGLRITFSVDLDQVAEASNDIDIAAKVSEKSSAIMTLENTTFEMRQRPTCQLPFSDTADETPEALAEKALELLPVDTELEGCVRYVSQKCQTMDISLWGRLRAVLHATETAELLPEFPLEDFEVNDTVRVRVRGPAPHPRVTPHLVLLEASMKAEDDEKVPRKIADLAVGKKYSGVITSVGLPGVYVAVSSTVTVRIKRCNLSSAKYDKWLSTTTDPRDIEKVKEFFPVGKRCDNVRIVSVSLSAGLAEGTLRSDAIAKALGREEGTEVTFESVKVGDTLPAKVKAETSFGLFVTLEGSNRLDALCPKDEIHDEGDETNLETGDLVLVKVLSKDEQRRRLRVGLKSSYFNELDLQTATEETTGDMAETSGDVGENSGDMDDETSTGKEEDEVTSEGESDATSVDETETETGIKGLVLTDRNWLTESELVAKEEKLEDFLHASFTQKKSKGKETRRELDETDDNLTREKELRKVERSIAQGDWEEDPQTVDDFERLVLIKPNDSTTWIKYMAHYVELQDRVKAAEVAQRGIDRLDPTLTTDRCDIWLAWLNMEYAFGTKADQESLLARALQYNDPVKVYLHMISLMESLALWKDLDLMSVKMLKKQGLSKDLWIRYLTSLYIRDRKTAELKGGVQSTAKDLSTRTQIDETLKRAINRLPKTEHIELKTTVARLEFKYGQPERARGMFASILDSVPKRTDVWNVLFDAQLMSLKSGKRSAAEISCARQLFMKACSVDLRVGKAKSMYKRWLNFETTWGDAAGVGECRRRAELFVKSQLAEREE